MLLCPTLAIKGRTSQGNTAEEIINLEIDESSKRTKENIIYLRKNDGTSRAITVDNYAMNILIEAKNETIYTINNGEYSGYVKRGREKLTINKVGNYVFRKSKAKLHEQMSLTTINNRLIAIKKYLNNPFLTITSLYESGMINMGLDIMGKEQRELVKKDYINIAEAFDYGEESDNYYGLVKRMIQKQIEINKSN